MQMLESATPSPMNYRGAFSEPHCESGSANKLPEVNDSFNGLGQQFSVFIVHKLKLKLAQAVVH
jgi:hypothetical protein